MKLSKENKYLILAVIVMLGLSHKLALERTFITKKTYDVNFAKKEAFSNLPQQLSTLSQKEASLDKALQELNFEDTSMQNNLLKLLNKEVKKNKVKLINFNAPHSINSQNQRIDTYIFNLEGSYTNILKTIHSLENKGGFGAITHTSFKKEKDYRTNRTYLKAEIFLEQVR